MLDDALEILNCFISTGHKPGQDSVSGIEKTEQTASLSISMTLFILYVLRINAFNTITND